MYMLDERPWEYEAVGDFTFRVSKCRNGLRGWLSEAIRGQFKYNTSILNEPEEAECWFEFGETKEIAMRKLKMELLS